MTTRVTDSRSNPNDQIAHAVEVINRSKDRLAVFEAIYFGKQKVKSVAEIAKATSLSPKRVLEEAKKLSSNEIVHQSRQDGGTVYEKDDFYSIQKKKILALVRNPRGLDKLPTKVRPHIRGNLPQVLQVRPKTFSVQQITIDDIDSFRKVRKVHQTGAEPEPMAEARFKRGVKRIIGEAAEFNDWGGERNDLCTTRIKFKGKRRGTAFAFKGKGLKRKLTPALMGKNGDQIQRLFSSPAEVFILQYWFQIEDSVREQMEMAAKIRSWTMCRTIYYCIIDGQDSVRLIKAYPKAFRG